MRKNENAKGLIINIFTFVILMIAIYFAYQFYQSNNFNGFIRSEAKLNISEFKRDKKVKYSDSNSYKITSNEFNDAMFSKEIEVEKNTPYKVTCMVKTKGVEADKNASSIGAQISISNTVERSVAISGDSDWQQVEFIFNSKNREMVDIVFRLGGTEGYAKGEAWFSDFKIEEGQPDIAVIYVAIIDWSERHSVISGLAGENTGAGSWNPATMEGLDAEKEKVIAYGLYDITTSTAGEDLVDLTIPLNFYDKDAAAPQGNYTLVISCSCSKYGDYLNGCSSNVMYVDDFQWVY